MMAEYNLHYFIIFVHSQQIDFAELPFKQTVIKGLAIFKELIFSLACYLLIKFKNYISFFRWVIIVMRKEVPGDWTLYKQQYWERGEDTMPTKIEDVTLYSVPEVSHMLDVPTVSIHNYIKQGYLHTQKVMGRHVIVEEELRDFFKKLSLIQTIYWPAFARIMKGDSTFIPPSVSRPL